MASFIQAKAGSATTADQSVTFDSNVTAGSLLVLTMGEGATPPGDPTITDTLGNTWRKAQGGGRNFIMYTVSSSGGACTVSINSQGTSSTRAVILEFGGTWGTSPLDTLATPASVSASPAASNAATPSSANGVMVGFLFTISNATSFAISAGGYTIGPVAGLRCVPSYRVFSSAAAYSVTYTAGAGISAGGTLQNVAFIESASSGPGFRPYYITG